MAGLDPDTQLLGLMGIGARVYDELACEVDEDGVAPGSIREAELAVFGHLFDQIWPDVSDEGRRLLREDFAELYRMVADHELRQTRQLFDKTIPEARAKLSAEPAS